MKTKTLLMTCIMMMTALALTACADSKQTSDIANKNTNTAETLLEATTASVEAVTETTLEMSEQLSNNKTEYALTQITQTAKPAYTYTDAELAMYATAAVNVRTLPSTDGTKLGSLSKNQQVIATGTCNETGWFRIIYADAIGYVSNKYLTTAAPVVVATPTQTPVAAVAAPIQPIAAPITGPVPQAPQSKMRDGFDLSTQEGLMGWLEAGHSSTEIIDEDPNLTKTTYEIFFNRTTAEEIFTLVNAERTAAGIPALIWSEDLYNIAVQRCEENDVHAGMRAGTSENYGLGDFTSDRLHNGWYNSPGHHANYMNSKWIYGAVAVKVTHFPNSGTSSGVSYEVFQ